MLIIGPTLIKKGCKNKKKGQNCAFFELIQRTLRDL